MKENYEIMETALESVATGDSKIEDLEEGVVLGIYDENFLRTLKRIVWFNSRSFDNFV